MRTVLAFVAILLAAAGPASAHAFLERSNPGAGAVVTTPPGTLTLDFSEPLEPAFSGVVLSDTKGRAVAGTATTVAGSHMSVIVPALAPGAYKVRWHALSIDTHRTQGTFSFTVKP